MHYRLMGRPQYSIQGAGKKEPSGVDRFLVKQGLIRLTLLLLMGMIGVRLKSLKNNQNASLAGNRTTSYLVTSSWIRSDGMEWQGR